jgi:hypothetical protein
MASPNQFSIPFGTKAILLLRFQALFSGSKARQITAAQIGGVPSLAFRTVFRDRFMAPLPYKKAGIDADIERRYPNNSRIEWYPNDQTRRSHHSSCLAGDRAKRVETLTKPVEE